MHFYSFLCEEVLGRRPSAIRLMYLRTGETITALPSAQSVKFITTRTTAVWKAVERACTTGNFLPRPGPLCASCSFQQWCPAFGGDPELAAVEAPLRHAALARVKAVELVRPLGAIVGSSGCAATPSPTPCSRGPAIVGDFSVIWHLIAVGRVIIDPSAAAQSLAMAALIGAESLIVNQGVKRLFRRKPADRSRRPAAAGAPPVDIELPQRACLRGVLRRGDAHDGDRPRRWHRVWYSAAVIGRHQPRLRAHPPSLRRRRRRRSSALLLGAVGSRVFKALVQ